MTDAPSIERGQSPPWRVCGAISAATRTERAPDGRGSALGTDRRMEDRLWVVGRARRTGAALGCRSPRRGGGDQLQGRLRRQRLERDRLVRRCAAESERDDQITRVSRRPGRQEARRPRGRQEARRPRGRQEARRPAPRRADARRSDARRQAGADARRPASATPGAPPVSTPAGAPPVPTPGAKPVRRPAPRRSRRPRRPAGADARPKPVPTPGPKPVPTPGAPPRRRPAPRRLDARGAVIAATSGAPPPPRPAPRLRHARCPAGTDDRGKLEASDQSGAALRAAATSGP